MVNYSYRVLKSAGKGWDWQLISPSGKIFAHGVADARAKAAAHAMLAWLDRLEEQGDAIQRDTGVVRHQQHLPAHDALRPIVPQLSRDLNCVASRFFDIPKFLTHVVSKVAGLILEMKKEPGHHDPPPTSRR